jgi:hypothetical protein
MQHMLNQNLLVVGLAIIPSCRQATPQKNN